MKQVLHRTLTILVVGLFYFSGYSQILESKTLQKVSKGILTTEISFLIQINNPGERYLGDIKIYHGDDDKFKILEAHVLDMNGAVLYKPKNKNILTRSVFSRSIFHQDNLITEFKLYGATYPYQIRYSYERKNKNFIYLTYWRPRIYKKHTPVKSILEIEIPKDYSIEIKDTSHFKFTESTTSGRGKKLTWQLNKLKIPSQELYAPKNSGTIPSVIVSPKEFYYGVKGSLSSWKEFGDWYLRLNAGNTDLTQEEKNKVDTILDEIDSKKETIKKLYHYLQDHTTYVNVALDLGGLKSYPASYVCKNKYGDCKALTTYMKGLLSYAGVSSNYVVIKSGSNKRTDVWIDKDVPGPQFNHILLAVPLDSDTIWLENTSTALPFNFVNTSMQNRKSLWINEGKSQLIQMPKLTVDDVLNTSKYTLNLNKKGNGSVAIALNKKGDFFEYTAYLKKINRKKTLEKNLIKSVGLKKFQLNNLDIINQHRDSTSIDLKMTGTVTNQIITIEKMNVIIPPKIKLPKFVKPKSRKKEVKINTPIHEKITTQYHLSGFNKINMKPRQGTIETKYGSYKYDVTLDHQKIKTHETFILKTNRYTLSEYTEFYEFLKSVKNQQKQLDLLFTIN